MTEPTQLEQIRRVLELFDAGEETRWIVAKLQRIGHPVARAAALHLARGERDRAVVELQDALRKPERRARAS